MEKDNTKQTKDEQLREDHLDRDHDKVQNDKIRLDKMRDAYQNIPVPKEAKDRMIMGMEQAKAEGLTNLQSESRPEKYPKDNRKNRTVIRFLKHAGLTAAAAFAVITVLANATPTTAHAMENIPVIGAIAKVVTFRTFEDEHGNYEVKVEVPKVSLNNGADDSVINQSIEEYANQLIAQYEAELAKDQAGEGHYAMNSTYEVVTDNGRYFSIEITTTVTMASGAQSVKIFTVDKAAGKVVSLKELAGGSSEKLNAISDNIKQQMVEHMAEDDSKIYFYNSGDEAMAESEFQGITGEESYYFDGNGEVVIVFDEYQVAPGYMGIVEFTIPQSVITPLSE